jgi:hypothetical protein
MIVNGELDCLVENGLQPVSRTYYKICLEGVRKKMKSHSKYLIPWITIKLGPLKYKSHVLKYNQPCSITGMINYYVS